MIGTHIPVKYSRDHRHVLNWLLSENILCMENVVNCLLKTDFVIVVDLLRNDWGLHWSRPERNDYRFVFLTRNPNICTYRSQGMPIIWQSAGQCGSGRWPYYIISLLWEPVALGVGWKWPQHSGHKGQKISNWINGWNMFRESIYSYW